MFYTVNDVVTSIQNIPFINTSKTSLDVYMIYTYQYFFENKISKLLYDECMEHYLLDDVQQVSFNQRGNVLSSWNDVMNIHKKMGVDKYSSYYDFLRIKEILTLQGNLTKANIPLQLKLYNYTSKGQRQARNIKEVAKYIQQLKGYNFLEHGLPSSVSPEQFIHHCSYTTDNEYLWYDSLKEIGV